MPPPRFHEAGNNLTPCWGSGLTTARDRGQQACLGARGLGAAWGRGGGRTEGGKGVAPGDPQNRRLGLTLASPPWEAEKR